MQGGANRAVTDAAPDVQIILLSAEFSEDEFDTSRLAICDVSLRLPISFARVEHALIEAELNNAVWRARTAGFAAAKRGLNLSEPPRIGQRP